MKIGDRVEILRKDIKLLGHRKRPLYGFITYIDGSYIGVRPNHCTWMIELYHCEIKGVNDESYRTLLRQRT